MLESIEKLRKMDAGNLVAMGDGEYVRDTRHDRIADAIEAEIAERYMELPVGKDGKPLRFGETVYGKDGRAWVVRSYKPAPYSVRVSAADNGTDKRHVKAGWMTHEKPRTIEDVLESFIEDYDHWDEFAHFERGESRNKLFARYADEVRKAVE